MNISLNKPRLEWLDYFRGFCALGIMLYHYVYWEIDTAVLDASTFLGKVGVYGVSMFYVLSGLTLYQVYQHKLEANYSSIRNFYIKRFFRIFPLLWIVIIATIILNRQIPDWQTLFLNFTGLFGFIKWNGYIATGAWSIGNELVFYALFPLFFIFSKKTNKTAFWFITLVVSVLFVYFSFFKISTVDTLTGQWRDYVNPLNQVPFFFGGFLIGFFFNKKKNTFFSQASSIYIQTILVIVAILSFIFYPVKGDLVNIVTGWNRIAFILICLCLCTCFYKASASLPNFIHYPLSKLGEATYSVYLIHPLVRVVTQYVSKHFFFMDAYFLIGVSVILTIITSLLVYYLFEKKFMNLANRIIEKMETKNNLEIH